MRQRIADTHVASNGSHVGLIAGKASTRFKNLSKTTIAKLDLVLTFRTHSCKTNRASHKTIPNIAYLGKVMASFPI